LAVTRDPARAEDAVHDAFVRMLKREALADDKNGDVSGDLTAYAYTAVRNAAIDQIRRQATVQKHAASIYRHADTHDPSPDRYVEEAERDRLLQEAVDALPEAQRTAVVLHTHAGLTFAQIAQTLGEPQPTVASRYRRALEKIAYSLGSLAR
jgi:RNA polymerase sigma-70 factor (ECF subfamily)